MQNYEPMHVINIYIYTFKYEVGFQIGSTWFINLEPHQNYISETIIESERPQNQTKNGCFVSVLSCIETTCILTLALINCNMVGCFLDCFFPEARLLVAGY